MGRRTPARERLLRAAAELLYRDGVGATGIAVGAKVSLYSNLSVQDAGLGSRAARLSGETYEAVIRVNSQSGKGGVAWVLEQDKKAEAAQTHADRFQQTCAKAR